MRRRVLTTGVAAAVAHFVLALASLMIAFRGGMEAFDNRDYQLTAIERVAELTAGVLLQPGMSVAGLWRGLPNAAEWALFLGNSLLWGFAIALLANGRSLLVRARELDTRDA